MCSESGKLSKLKIIAGGEEMVRLRSYKRSDADYLKRWIVNERFCHQWGAKNFRYPLDDLQLNNYADFLESSENDFSFMALNETDGLPIGHIKIGRIDFSKFQGVLQFVLIGDRKYRGKGYGKEMLRLTKVYAFEILKLKRLLLGVFTNNESALKFYESIGFQIVKHHEKFYKYKKEIWDVFDMEVEK